MSEVVDEPRRPSLQRAAALDVDQVAARLRHCDCCGDVMLFGAAAMFRAGFVQQEWCAACARALVEGARTIDLPGAET